VEKLQLTSPVLSFTVSTVQFGRNRPGLQDSDFDV